MFNAIEVFLNVRAQLAYNPLSRRLSIFCCTCMYGLTLNKPIRLISCNISMTKMYTLTKVHISTHISRAVSAS